MSLLERRAPDVLEGPPTAAYPTTKLAVAASEEVTRLPASCAICTLRNACLPCDLLVPKAGTGRKDPLIQQRSLKRGEYLYRAGDPFHNLYTVRMGCIKTVQCLDGGRDQVTGFYMTGDLLGVDGISALVHGSDAIALEDTRVCLVPYGRIEHHDPARNEVVRALHKAMSAEIVRQYSVMLLLGTMSAEERVAAFLLNLSERFLARGYSPSQFLLRMTRRDIGSYLGLKLETVSRIFSHFRDQGIVGVERRNIFLRDLAGLRRCSGIECVPTSAAHSRRDAVSHPGHHPVSGATEFALS
jgi:CRP/FNR family transcriptional regulator